MKASLRRFFTPLGMVQCRPDYLTNIIKTVSRLYQGITLNGSSVSFVRFDVDDFSRFNSRHGRETGDRVLVAIASILKESSRPTDYVIRFGGKEFDVLLPGTRREGAETYTRKIFEKIERMSVSHEDDSLRVMVSAGISMIDFTLPEKMVIDEKAVADSFVRLQAEADDALYDAKYQGKSRFCFYSPDKKEEYLKIRKLYVK
jgi:diguanylate cyclase (GGDEF)-like protein